MKKTIIILGLAAACAFALTGCVKEESLAQNNGTAVSEGVPFELTLGFADTKTTIDENFKVEWEEGDAINVFHAEAGTANYINDGQFVVNEAGLNGKFSGKLAQSLDKAKAYDWYVVYPYSEETTTPANAVFRFNRSAAIPENGENVNLKGLPLWSNVKNLSGSTNPILRLHQVYSVAKLTFNNVNCAPVTIGNMKISFEDMYDSYHVDGGRTVPTGDVVFDLTGNAVAVTPLNGGYNPKHSTISYTGKGYVLKTGESWSVYNAIIPMVLPANTSICFTPNPDMLKKIVMNKEAIEFKAGEIKEIVTNFDRNEFFISEEEMADPILFRFCMPSDYFGSNPKDSGYDFWEQKKSNPKFLSVADHYSILQEYNQDTEKTDVYAKAYLSMTKKITDKCKYADTEGRFYLATTKIDDGNSLTANAKFAKLPAGKKFAFYTSFYLAKADCPNVYTFDYSFDGGNTFAPATVTAGDPADVIDGNQITFEMPGTHLCHPIVVKTDAAPAAENATVVIRITIHGSNATSSSHLGFAPYYEFNAAEGLRVYSNGGDSPAWKWIKTAESKAVPGAFDDITGCAYLTIE